MLFNRSRAIAYMEQHHLDTLVATSPVNITYFTDFFSWLDPLFKEYMGSPGAPSNLAQSYAVFPRLGEPALIVSPLNMINGADSWVRDVQTFGIPGVDDSLPPGGLPETLQSFALRLRAAAENSRWTVTATDALVGVLRQRGLATGRIGIEMEGLAAQTKENIARAFPQAQLKDCSNLIRLVRMVKSPAEIQRLTRAAEIAEMAAMESYALARPGVLLADLAQHFRARIAAMGADFDHFAYAVHGLGMASEVTHVLSASDVMWVDFGCIYRHYFSDSGTTLAMHDLPPALMERRDALRNCVLAGAEIIQPGVKSSAVQGGMWQTLEARGITTSFPHGHGMGLDLRDYPILVADNRLRIRDDCVDVPSDLPLEQNMVINLEASLFMPGVASLHVEQSFLVTANGCRSLVVQDRSRPIVQS
ncbi:MAG: aminopeptidase P family protein [Chloroflexi bacterium]|nr:aminopeptidase P family protein [Chloroflexota bacterium]